MKVVWSDDAIIAFSNIIIYWIETTGNNSFSNKLNERIFKNIQLISDNIYIGRKTSQTNIRSHVVGNYTIFYRIKKTYILINTVWDNRRDPKTFKIKI